MKILGLRLKNINSLKGSHELNFNEGPLGQTGLFAITGPTGSGKSTLLDAITLALFNHTPRSGRLSKNEIQRHGSVITRNTDEAFSEVDYQVGETVYRSSWSISRARTGNLREYDMVLAQQQEDGTFQSLDFKKSEVPDGNAEIIGLNYDQFVKSILLSQGEFARFLKANANERGELLEKITGTELYRQIGQAAYNKVKEERQKLEDLQKRLEGIELLDTEEREALEGQVTELNERSKEMETLRKTQSALLQVKEQIEKVKRELENKEKEQIFLFDNIKAFEPQKSRLERHHQLLPLAPALDRWQFLQKEAQSLSRKGELQEKEEETLKGQLEQVRKKEISNQQQLTFQEDQKIRLKPVLKEVRELDQQQYQTLSRKNEKEQELNARKKSCNEVAAELKKLDGDFEKLQRELKDSLLWLEQHQVLEEAADQHSMWEAAWKDLSFKSAAWNRQLNEEEGGSTEKALKNSISWKQRKEILSQALEKGEMYVSQLSGRCELSSEKEEAAKEEQEALIARQKGLESLLYNASRYVDLSDQIAQQEKRAKDLTKSIAEDEAQKVTFSQALEILAKEVESLELLRQKQALEAKYEEARKLLRPAEPCPLCGSLEHPYVREYENTLDETAKKLQSKKGEAKELENKEKALVEKIQTLKGEQKGLNSALERDRKKREELLVFHDQGLKRWGYPSMAPDVEWFKRENQQVEVHIKNLKDQLALLEKIRRSRTKLDRLKEWHKQVTELDQGLASLEVKLTPFSPFCPSQTAIPEKLTHLKALISEYRAKGKMIQELQVKEKGMAVEIKKKNESREELNQNLQVLQNEYKDLENQIKKLKEKRDDLFGEKQPDEVEMALEKEEKKLQTEQLMIREGLANLTRGEEELKRQIQEREEQQKVNYESFQKVDEDLKEELDSLSIADPKEAVSLCLSSEEARQLETEARSLERRQTEVKQAIREYVKRMEELGKADTGELTKEDLTKEVENLTLEVTKLAQEQGGITTRLKIDEENRQKQQSLVDILESRRKETDRWEQLNELIGDASGNKFSKFAQELTLRQLLGLANQHLKRLNNRYWVKHQREDKVDELFVVDTWHGEEERSVKTLSGGESFLVSLSLALALSDLAGRMTRVESLFIDEGFGTLDQETLEVALTTLEKLQHETNRTIGLISHVTALQERIATRIQLQPDSSGYSSLEIVG